MLSEFLQHYVIQGKDLYVVDDHHKAMAAWTLVRRSLPIAPNLITIDHHTDTHEAFMRYTYWETAVRTLEARHILYHEEARLTLFDPTNELEH